jgi:hypothetical protein
LHLPPYASEICCPVGEKWGRVAPSLQGERDIGREICGMFFSFAPSFARLLFWLGLAPFPQGGSKDCPNLAVAFQPFLLLCMLHLQKLGKPESCPFSSHDCPFFSGTFPCLPLSVAMCLPKCSCGMVAGSTTCPGTLRHTSCPSVWHRGEDCPKNVWHGGAGE